MTDLIMQFKQFVRLFLLVPFITVALSSCATIAAIGAVKIVADLATDRRSAGEYIDDNTIELTANNYLLSKSKIRDSAHVKPISWNGILLITGEVDDEEIKQDMIAYFNNIDGVRQLVDETTITGKTPLSTRANDTWITSKVKTRLIAKTGLDANRVKVTTTRSVVYLMGIVTEDEGDRAADQARRVRGVKKVVKVFEYKDAEQQA